MTDRAELPKLDELPIPTDAKPDRTWTSQMLDLASLIGPYATLRIVETRGGERVYISADPAASPFSEALTDDQAAVIARHYAGNVLQVPVARTALRRARRAGVLAAARAKTISVADVGKILQTSRTYASELVNHADEADGAAPIRSLRRPTDPRQIDMFPEPAEEA